MEKALEMTRRLLAVSWTMPPLVYPRSLQVSRLLKGLSALDWEIDVLTVHPADLQGYSDPLFASAYESCYNLHYLRVGEDVVVTPLVQRVKRRLNPPSDFSADNFLRRGLQDVLRMQQKNSYDALITFAQPWVDHLLGLAVKARCPQLPWLAHFSDPWADNPFDVEQKPAHQAALRGERSVVEAADAVAFVSDETADLVMKKYSLDMARKAFVLPHAFDDDLKQLLPPYPQAKGQMRIVYTGSVYPGKRTPDVALRALARLNELPGVRDQVSIDFIGYVPPEYPGILEGMGLFGQVRFLGSAGYMTALAAASSATALLLIDAAADVSVFLPSKIVDYLMFNKPILGVTPHTGASADFLRKFGHAIAAPDDEEAVYSLLKEAFRKWSIGEWQSVEAPQYRSQYDVHTVAAICHDRLLQICGAEGRA